LQGQQIPAGWYGDPQGRPGLLCYWDGRQWTEHYQHTAVEALPRHQATVEPERRYYSLRTIATIYQVLAWLIAVVGGVGVIVTAVSSEGSSGALVFIAGAIYIFFLVLTFFAVAAFIRLMLSVEQSTRTTATALVALRDAQATR
jgi:hypothetical protein